MSRFSMRRIICIRITSYYYSLNALQSITFRKRYYCVSMRFFGTRFPPFCLRVKKWAQTIPTLISLPLGFTFSLACNQMCTIAILHYIMWLFPGILYILITHECVRWFGLAPTTASQRNIVPVVQLELEICRCSGLIFVLQRLHEKSTWYCTLRSNESIIFTRCNICSGQSSPCVISTESNWTKCVLLPFFFRLFRIPGLLLRLNWNARFKVHRDTSNVTRKLKLNAHKFDITISKCHWIY